MGLNYFTINGNDSNYEKEGMILEPNYQPEPPSNQNGDREDEDFGFTPKELSRMYLDELLNLVNELLNMAFNFSQISGQTKVSYLYMQLGKVKVAYQTYCKHESKSQEI